MDVFFFCFLFLDRFCLMFFFVLLNDGFLICLFGISLFLDVFGCANAMYHKRPGLRHERREVALLFLT